MQRKHDSEASYFIFEIKINPSKDVLSQLHKTPYLIYIQIICG